MIGFKVQIKAPAIREDIIRKQVETSTETERFFDFRNHESQLKRVRLPQDVLVYRMENFRTFTEQQTYLAREKKPQGFFAGGQENESVQQVQHDILAQLARKGEGDSVVPVIDVLRTAGQREPLLITSRGVIVNGNRRLAAMRELLAEDSTAFQEFSTFLSFAPDPLCRRGRISSLNAWAKRLRRNRRSGLSFSMRVLNATTNSSEAGLPGF